MTWTLGYGTNGLGDHSLPQALDLIQESGYRAVALTLGFPHLDPWAGPTDLRLLRRRLEDGGLTVVVETGTRFLLDPRRKHAPALVDPDADARIVYLHRAMVVAEALGADTVQFFSGVLGPDGDIDAAHDRLRDRVGALATRATEHGIRLALEPEPGMVIETVADALALRSALGDPASVGLTVDIGHCLVVEPGGVDGALAEAAPALAHVQIDDMPRTHHEHRPFGEGDLDLPAALAALDRTDYDGVVSVELPRHSWDAPHQLRHSHSAITRAMPTTATPTGVTPAAGPTPPHPATTPALAATTTPAEIGTSGHEHGVSHRVSRANHRSRHSSKEELR